jgi:hypothetical protein
MDAFPNPYAAPDADAYIHSDKHPNTDFDEYTVANADVHSYRVPHADLHCFLHLNIDSFADSLVYAH